MSPAGRGALRQQLTHPPLRNIAPTTPRGRPTLQEIRDQLEGLPPLPRERPGPKRLEAITPLTRTG